MSDYGLTPEGWVAKPATVIKQELDTGLKSGPLGESAGTEPDGSIPAASIAGQLEALIVDPFAALWDLGQDVQSGFDPASANDVAQDQVNSITGTIRDPATYSTVAELCVGKTGTPLPKGRGVTVTGTNALFQLVADAIIGAATAWSNNGGAGTNYTKGDVRKNVGNVYLCITTGLGSTLAGGPTGKGTDITDGTAHWRFIGAGDGFVTATFRAATTGPVGALVGSLVTIATPVMGWTAAYNATSAVVGANRETNTVYRFRREAELHSQGDSANDAIRARVQAVGQGTTSPVTTVSVFSNRTDFTSPAAGITPTNIPDGMPPHSVMVLADYDGGVHANPELEQAIAQAIWDAVGGGIATTFAEAVGDGYAFESTVTDSEGRDQTVYWARPHQIAISANVAATYDNTPGVAPSEPDLTAMIKGGVLSDGRTVFGALPTYGESYGAGKNVWGSALSAAVFDGPISTEDGSLPAPGILDVSVEVSRNGGPFGPALVITVLERATFDSGDIVVVLTGSAP